MTMTVTLEVPADLAERARQVAERTQRRVEEVLVDWLSRIDAVEGLSDAEVLALCDSQLAEAAQVQLSELLDRQREGLLKESEKPQLAGLLQEYRRGLVRKAQALKTAASRGLRPRWDEPRVGPAIR
jgi:hypothetical protein